jgi:hypothetical protein
MENQFNGMSKTQLQKILKKLTKAKGKFGNDDGRDRKINSIEDILKTR